MPTANQRSVNAAIRQAGIPLQMIKGHGYYYFDADDSSLQVDSIFDSTPWSYRPVEAWVADALGAYYSALRERLQYGVYPDAMALRMADDSIRYLKEHGLVSPLPFLRWK